MNTISHSTSNHQKATIYQIKIKGHLGSQWADWFEGLTITLDEQGFTTLTGPITDDAALYGLLKRVRDLGMGLISVNRIEEALGNDTEIIQNQKSMKEKE